tara:strand:+ start:1691 stop:2218 length:528 start_codon:yes stop_codon:yes gene_type:complete
LNKFIAERYEDIMLMAKKICKSHHEYEDVGHFAITEFMQHERGQELVDSNRAMNFLSGIIWRSFHSGTSQYHTIYRQKGRVHSLPESYDNKADDDEYDFERDIATEAIQGILEDMRADGIDLWYRSTLFEMWIKEPNFSELARQTGIPRTSISKAVEEAKKHIREELNKNGINYD